MKFKEQMLRKCNICPRNCKVNRLLGERGYCNTGVKIKVAKAYLHQWEEPCISGSNGSGTVFFSNCNLKCVFCQNHVISQDGVGQEISIEKLSEIFLNLEKKGAHNINLVTATSYTPQVIEAIDIAKEAGLCIPVVYNTNSYENVDTIKALDGRIDVYLPDLKYYDDKYAIKYSKAPDYFKYATKAIEEMVLQVGKPVFDQDGILKKGVIIRHLMLPGLLFDSKKVIDYIYRTFGDSVYISIMNQYTPMHEANKYEEINRTLKEEYYDRFINYCYDLGIRNAFIQEGGSSSEEFVPDFYTFD